MPAPRRFRTFQVLTTAITCALVAGTAAAGGGGTLSKIAVDLQAQLVGVTQSWAIDTGPEPALVYQHDASAPMNPEGISIIRGGNHKIPRKSPGVQLELGRAVGDADGSIAVVYGSGLQRYTRVIKADNTLAFDVHRPAHRLAGVTPDGEGGAYLVTHAAFKPPGSALADHTKHTTVRYSPTGTVLWEVQQPPVPTPYTMPQHRSVAAKSSLGVFVGYAVDGRSDQPKPILLHRAEADGSVLFAQQELHGPKLSAGQIVLGEVGTGALEGLVEEVVAASDGSVLAVVHDHGQQQWVIRVDASGQQTATFVCDGKAVPIAPAEIACIKRGDPESFSFSRYGISGGNLERTLDVWKAPKQAGRTYGTIAGLPGRQLLVSVREDDQLGLVLLAKTGTLLTSFDANNDLAIGALGANGGKWIGAGSSAVARGTYVIGGSSPGASAPQANPSAMPKAVKKQLP